MASSMRSMRRIALRLALLALLALALFPPGPTRALAQSDPPPALPFHLFLPLGGNTAPAPDLIFTPDSVQLTPGAQASVTVRVEPQADLRGASFELPGVQDGVTSRFEAAPDGQSGTLTIEASTAAEAAERALMVQGRSGDGSKGWVGKLKVTTTASTTAKTFFVDPVTGKDSNSGLQSKPFKTLTKALSVAKSGDTVKLAPGVYSKATNGEPFTGSGLLVPSGVTLEGPSTGDRALLKGTGIETALLFQGNVTVKNLEVDNFDFAMRAAQGQQSLSNLLMLEDTNNFTLTGSAQTTLIGSTIVRRANPGRNIVSASEQTQFTMFGGKISGGSPNCGTGQDAIDLSNAARANLQAVTVENVPTGMLHMRDTSKATLNAQIDRSTPAGCTFLLRASVSAFDAASLNFDGSIGGASADRALRPAAISWGSSGPLKVSGQIANHQTGITLGTNAKLTVDGGSFLLNNTGIFASGTSGASVTINNAQFIANVFGVKVPNLKVRNSKFVGDATSNSIAGISINAIGFALADLGQVGDPGGNTIQLKTGTGVTFDSGVIQGGAFANGNRWNPLTQGSDESGNYEGDVTVDGRHPFAHGKNFDLPNLNLVMEL